MNGNDMIAGLPPRRHRRRWVILAAALVVLAAGVLTAIGGVFSGGASDRASGGDGSGTSLAVVVRRSLSTESLFNGTLGFAGSFSVLARAPGTVTWLPRVGRVVRQGQVLFRVDGAPVVLLYGSTPAWRPLAEGGTAGADVAQLNRDLAALGYVQRSAVDAAWREFSWATKAAVEELQQHLGVARTGRLGLGAVVFLPTAARITALRASLGGPAAGPVLSATSTRRVVRVALDADLQSEVRAGDRVAITLPDGRSTPGRVAAVGRVATSTESGGSGGAGSGPTVPVTIRLTEPTVAGGLDQALVEVAVTDRTVRDVLAVPVTALLARAGGGFAVEVVAADGAHRLVPVRVGLFDDAAGLVQVSGSRLAAGQRVVVPGNE